MNYPYDEEFCNFLAKIYQLYPSLLAKALAEIPEVDVLEVAYHIAYYFNRTKIFPDNIGKIIDKTSLNETELNILNNIETVIKSVKADASELKKRVNQSR